MTAKPAEHTNTSPAETATPDLVAQIQQHQSEVARLLELCQHLRRTSGCPGRCVRGAARERVLREFRELDVFRNSTVQEEPDDWQ
jgi:hypothetical protein